MKPEEAATLLSLTRERVLPELPPEPAAVYTEALSMAIQSLLGQAVREGIWETGPEKGELCPVCGKVIDPARAQFLGLSNGDWAWCCKLGCLIEEAKGEQELYTDGVGPEEPR